MKQQASFLTALVMCAYAWSAHAQSSTAQPQPPQQTQPQQQQPQQPQQPSAPPIQPQQNQAQPSPAPPAAPYYPPPYYYPPQGQPYYAPQQGQGGYYPPPYYYPPQNARPGTYGQPNYGQPGYGQPYYGQPGYDPDDYDQPDPDDFNQDRRIYGGRINLGFDRFQGSTYNGLSVAMRYRPRPRYAFDFGLGVLGASKRDLDMAQIPLFIDVNYFLNPDSVFQVYGKLGVSWVWINREGYEHIRGRYVDSTDTYFGGQAGFGVELRVAPTLAFTLESQLVGRLIMGEQDLYADPETNNRDSALGVLTSLGIMFYFD